MTDTEKLAELAAIMTQLERLTLRLRSVAVAIRNEQTRY